MARYQWENSVFGTLNAGISSGATSITVVKPAAPLNPPPTPAGGRLGIITIADNQYAPTAIEVITYTGLTDGGSTVTLTGCVRGVDGTTASSFLTGAHVYQAMNRIGALQLQDPAAVAITGGSITGITDLAVADGGTGASDATNARANLGLVIGTNVQAYDATLNAFAALPIAAESLTIGTGADAFTQVTFAANTFPARASTGSLVAKPISDFGLSLIDDAAASNARTTLGLGTSATVNTGTSGATIPLLNGVNTWSNTATFQTGAIFQPATGTLGISIELTNTGGTRTIGAENSAGSLFGATAYALVIGTPASRLIEFFVGIAKVGIIGSGQQTLGASGTTNTTLIRGSNSGTGGGAVVYLMNNSSNIIGFGNKSAIEGGSYSAVPQLYATASMEISILGTIAGLFTTTGLNACAIGASTASTGAFSTLAASGALTLGGGGTGSVLVTAGSNLMIGAGTRNAIRIAALADPNGVEIACTDSTGSIAYKPLAFNATSITLTETGGSRALSVGTTGVTANTNITAAGSIRSTHATNGVGYDTGAGGTVTQLTSKGTGVTINKASGQITTHNAALAAGDIAQFVVTNSSVTAADGVNLTLQSGPVSAGTYRYWITAVGSGTFTITIENRSAGSLSEALVFNFQVLKGATS